MLYKFLHSSSRKLILIFTIIVIIHKIARRTFKNKLLMRMATNWKINSGADFSTRVTMSKAVLSHNFVNLIFGVFSIAIRLYSASVFTFNTSNLKETDISMRPLISKMDFPFNSDIWFVYGLILIMQFFCTVLCSNTVVMLNALLFF